MMRIISALLIVVSAGPNLLAQEKSPGFFQFFKERTRFNMIVQTESALEFDHDFGGFDAQKSEWILRPEFEIDLPYQSRLTAIGRLRSDVYDRLEPGKHGQEEIATLSKRAYINKHIDFDLRELSFETTIGQTFVTLGKQQIVWGKADGLKVLDVVNPQDFREFILDEFDESRIPLWSANIEIPVKELVFQLVWLPEQTYHLIPEANSRYTLTAPRFVPTAPAGIPVILNKIKRPGFQFSNSDAGLRLSTFWEGWDLTLNYLYHYPDIPILFRTIHIENNQPLIVIEPEYKRTHLFGGTFSKAISQLTLRGEIGFSTDKYYLSKDINEPDGVRKTGELGYVLGFDWFGFSDTFLSLQLFQNWLTKPGDDLYVDQLETNLSFLVQRNFRNETLQVEVLGIQGVNLGDGLVRPKVSYEFLSNLKFWSGIDWFYGKSTGLLGQFKDRNRVILGMEWGVY